LRLSALWDREVQEAGTAAGQVVGFSADLAGVGYSVERLREELDAAVASGLPGSLLADRRQPQRADQRGQRCTRTFVSCRLRQGCEIGVQAVAHPLEGLAMVLVG